MLEWLGVLFLGVLVLCVWGKVGKGICWLRFCISGFSLNIIGIIIAYNK